MRMAWNRQPCKALAAMVPVAALLLCCCPARADDAARACAASPYHVGDLLRRLGPPGDSYYNSLHVRKIYVVFGPARKSGHPEPAYVQRIAGWLYLMDVSANDYTYNWYSRGYEMDRPLEYVYGTLATVVLGIARACT